jgi:hypothetical protein
MILEIYDTLVKIHHSIKLIYLYIQPHKETQFPFKTALHDHVQGRKYYFENTGESNMGITTIRYK